ncbi:MAG: hypothetical protein MZV70_07965 [Desulfobacterales bacterium]|nr:hypothetical protein [Desulfobacterales bacterium]
MDADRPQRSFAGLLALLTGLCAAGLSAAWLARFWEGGLRFAMLPPDDLTEFDLLMSNVLLTELYMFGVPILALMALAAGTVSCRERIGQIGLTLGVAAAVVYALALRSTLTLF